MAGKISNGKGWIKDGEILPERKSSIWEPFQKELEMVRCQTQKIEFLENTEKDDETGNFPYLRD